MTGKIYHIKSYPPESDEVKARLVMRPDDTEEKVFAFWTCCSLAFSMFKPYSRGFLLKVKARLQIYKQNSEAIISAYSDVMIKVVDYFVSFSLFWFNKVLGSYLLIFLLLLFGIIYFEYRLMQTGQKKWFLRRPILFCLR